MARGRSPSAPTTATPAATTACSASTSASRAADVSRVALHLPARDGIRAAPAERRADPAAGRLGQLVEADDAQGLLVHLELLDGLLHGNLAFARGIAAGVPRRAPGIPAG